MDVDQFSLPSPDKKGRENAHKSCQNNKINLGANQRLYQSRVNPKDISKIFLTHLHNDHFEGLPDLWMTPWFLLGRDHGFELWGPEGTAEMVQGMRAMFGHDLKERVNQFNPIETLAIQ